MLGLWPRVHCMLDFMSTAPFLSWPLMPRPEAGSLIMTGAVYLISLLHAHHLLKHADVNSLGRPPWTPTLEVLEVLPKYYPDALKYNRIP